MYQPLPCNLKVVLRPILGSIVVGSYICYWTRDIVAKNLITFRAPLRLETRGNLPPPRQPLSVPWCLRNGMSYGGSNMFWFQCHIDVCKPNNVSSSAISGILNLHWVFFKPILVTLPFPSR